jgi:hypothetical protein
VTVGNGLDTDAVGDGFEDPFVVLSARCFAQNAVYFLRLVYFKAEHAVNLWRIPVRYTAEAVGNVVCLPHLPLNVEVVDGEVLSPLLASCIVNFVDLFTLDSHERPVIGPDRELLHAKQVVPALLNRVHHCQCLQLDKGVGLLGWV